MSLRIVPSASHPTTATNLSSTLKASSSHPSAPSAPGLPDALRASHSQAASYDPKLSTAPHHNSAPTTSTHPLEARLSRWRATQHELKMTGIRRTFGLHEVLRREVELKIVREGEYRPRALGGSAGVSGDVLEGRDWGCDWDEIFGADDHREGVDFHTEMETRLKMNR